MENSTTDTRQYRTANEIYSSISQRTKRFEDFRSINVIGVFVCYKDQIDTIVLEDGTHDSYFYVRALDKSIIDVFRSYFRPGFIFRFLGVDCTATQNLSRYNPKTIRLNANDLSKVVVFEWLTISENDRFAFYNSQNPMILPYDWQIIEKLRNKWCAKINKVSIHDLKRILMSKKNCDFERATFMAQIVEIRQPSPLTLILRIWDGTKPDFEVRLPVNLANVNRGLENFTPARERNEELEDQSAGKAMYVHVLGDKVGCFSNRRPGEYVLLINTKIYYYNQVYPNIFRCEMNDNDRKDTESYQSIVFLNKASNLSQLLSKKLTPQTNGNSFELASNLIDPRIPLIEPPDSFEQVEDRNIVMTVRKFDEMKQDVNYQIFCKIVDVFPLDYTAFDLINLKCDNCNLDDSVRSLFGTDLEGLRRASEIFLTQNGINRKDVNCPNCLQAKAHFKFFIIFLLQDEREEQMIALLERAYCDRYFEMNPLEVIADVNNEEIFNCKFQDLLTIFNNLNQQQPNRHMVIKKLKNNYFIKNISVKRNLVL